MKVMTALTTTVAALFGVVQAMSIDDGFALDGTTTYCMGVNGEPASLIFDTLEASNAGRCPVGVTLTVAHSTFHVNEPITVKWTAKAIVDVSNSIFPNAIDPATQLPGAVTISKLYACLAGTNCATNVVGTPTGADGASTGPFAADGMKALETNTITIATAGDYIIVGIVALPGDATLNLAAEEYVAFKRISIANEDTTTDSSNSASSHNATIESGTIFEKTSDTARNESIGVSNSSPKPYKSTGFDDSTNKADQNIADSSNSTKSASTRSGKNGFGAGGFVMIAVVVGGCIVCVVGFAFVMRRRKENGMSADKEFNDNSDEKVDLSYIANITARNNDKNGANNIVSVESSPIIMSSTELGSELNSSDVGPPKTNLNTDEYSEEISQGAERTVETSNASSLSQSQSSMSNYGESIVSARQKYLEPVGWNGSVSSQMDSRLDSMEQAELKARGFGSISGFSMVSGKSEDNASRMTGFSEFDSNRDIGFSMSIGESQLDEDSRTTGELSITEDSRATGFSEAMDRARLDSEMSVDSYGFRASRASADSYSSGMSPYGRENSRISNFSVDSNIDN
ncbi:hypothetical protein PsorP6_002254 [Peronosclerospora sorghi]|uniref:Uncharacterized protein n=1 Tax=Peronosclerospora sorghi TaxID=230839 RepID=A0ACC0WZ95_9STRA|nr:hypothetical protein PsorP6_002254 [Peronosclerospora sorghi]